MLVVVIVCGLIFVLVSNTSRSLVSYIDSQVYHEVKEGLILDIPIKKPQCISIVTVPSTKPQSSEVVL